MNYEPIERALKDLNFTEPTEIQRRALPVSIESKRDVLGAAATGSGTCSQITGLIVVTSDKSNLYIYLLFFVHSIKVRH